MQNNTLLVDNRFEINNDSLAETESLEKDKLFGENKYLIHFLCCFSINDTNALFTNYLSRDKEYIEKENKIIEINKIDNSKMSQNEFENKLNLINDDELEINNANENRISTILSHYIHDYNNENIEAIYKGYFANKITGAKHKEKGNMFRMFYRLSADLKEIQIILLDPNHLLAIRENVEHCYDTYKNNSIDIKKIINDYKKIWG